MNRTLTSPDSVISPQSQRAQFSIALGNAGGTEVPTKMAIPLGIVCRFRSFALSTRTKANCTPAPRRNALKCGNKVNALLAFEVFFCSFDNAGGTGVPNKVVSFPQNRSSTSVFPAVDENEG